MKNQRETFNTLGNAIPKNKKKEAKLRAKNNDC